MRPCRELPTPPLQNANINIKGCEKHMTCERLVKSYAIHRAVHFAQCKTPRESLNSPAWICNLFYKVTFEHVFVKETRFS